jgi:DNA-binding NtrC family response regulator
MVSVIYVEDDPEVASFVCHILFHKYGISLHIFSSVKDALEWLTFTPADVIVSDYNMPEMNGDEFLKILRARGDHTPFILFSGAEDIKKLARAAAMNESLNILSKNQDAGKQINHLANMIRRAVQFSSNRKG